MNVHTIFFVQNQEASKDFFKSVLNQEPQLHVPGMTQFQLSEAHVLGLMPKANVSRILGGTIPPLDEQITPPKAELYMSVDNPELYLNRALKAGAKLLSPFQQRNWGDKAGYVMDLDGNILAFSTHQ